MRTADALLFPWVNETHRNTADIFEEGNDVSLSGRAAEAFQTTWHDKLDDSSNILTEHRYSKGSDEEPTRCHSAPGGTH